MTTRTVGDTPWTIERRARQLARRANGVKMQPRSRVTGNIIRTITRPVGGRVQVFTIALPGDGTPTRSEAARIRNEPAPRGGYRYGGPFKMKWS